MKVLNLLTINIVVFLKLMDRVKNIFNIILFICVVFLNEQAFGQSETPKLLIEQDGISVFLMDKVNLDCDTNILVIKSEKYKLEDIAVMATFSIIKKNKAGQYQVIPNCDVEKIKLFFFIKNSNGYKELVASSTLSVY